jgi:hypothetical protein
MTSIVLTGTNRPPSEGPLLVARTDAPTSRSSDRGSSVAEAVRPTATRASLPPSSSVGDVWPWCGAGSGRTLAV